MNISYLIFIIFFLIFEFESGKIRPNFDGIFGNGWDNETEEKLVDKKQTKIEQNENWAIDQMNGVEMGTDQIGQMSEYSNQNYIKNDQNIKAEPNDQQKREIIRKFHAIKEKLKQKGKYEWKNNNKIECKIAKLLGTNRKKIYKWKKELNLNKKMEKSFYEQKKQEFIKRFNEFKSLYGQGKQNEFVKELGICEKTFRKWKKELLPKKYHKTPNKYFNEDQLKIMKQYFEMKDGNPKISDKRIAKKLGVGYVSLFKWKKEFASISNNI